MSLLLLFQSSGGGETPPPDVETPVTTRLSLFSGLMARGAPIRRIVTRRR